MIVYDYYRIFYYVGKYKTFTKAAKVLKNSQSNITRSIKNLENELGCQLFIRSHQGVKFTPEGEELFQHVAIAYEHLQVAENQILKNRALQTGSLSIGITETALHTLLISKLEQFHELYPQIKIHIYNYSTLEAIDALKKGLVNIAVVTTPFQAKKPLKYTIVQSFEEILIAGEKYKDLKNKKIHFKELLNYPMIGLNKDTITYQFYNDLFIKNHLSYQIDIEVASANQILPLVSHNLGLAFIPKVFIENDISSNKIYQIPLENDIPHRQICMIKNTEYPLPLAALKFEEMILS